MKKKLRSRRGMTLTETLMALLIASLVSIAVAVGIASAARVYRDSVAPSESQLLSATLSQAMMDELRYARHITSTEPPTFDSENFGSGAAFSVNTETGRLQLGGQDLVGSGTYAKNTLQIGNAANPAGGEFPLVSWDGRQFETHFAVLRGTDVLQQDVTFCITPLNS